MQNLIIRIVACYELVNLVVVVGQVVTNLPTPILCYDRTISERELKTLVVELTYVACNLVAEVRTSCNSYSVDKVGCLTIIVVNACCESVVCKTKIKTCVVCSCLFPCKSSVKGIRTICQTIANNWIICSDTVGCIRGKIRIVANSFLLTCLTPAKTEFHVADCLYIAKDRLLLDFPCQSCRWEYAPALILMET